MGGRGRRGYRPCPTPECPHVARAGELCDDCRSARQQRVDAARPSAAARGYGAAWQRIRRRYLREHPFCEQPGCGRPAVDVDHLDGTGPRGDNSDANLQALCHGHHSAKTVRRDGGFGRRPAAS